MIRKFLNNNFFAFFLVVPFTVWFFSSLFSPVFVSAADSVSFPDDFSISSTVDSTVYKNAFDKLKENSNLPDDSYVLLNIYGQNCEIFIISSDFNYEYSFQDGFWGGNTSVFFADCVQFFCTFDNLDSFEFSLVPYDFSSTTQFRLAYNSTLIFPWFAVNTQIVNGSPVVINNNPNYRAIFNNKTPPFVSDFDEIPLPFFSLDIDDFYTWLVNNDKIAVSVGSGGVSVDGKIPAYIGVQKLKSFLQFYKSYGSSNQSFVKNIVKWFSFMNIVGQSKDNINILKNTIDNLYNEYINYRSGTHAYWPGATKIQERNDIDTQTDNNNLTLVTDDSNDTLDISILRDILRGVIAISNNLIQGVSDIVTALNQLDFTVNVANNGGTGFDANSIWGTGDITQTENYLALTNAFMDKGVDVSAAENMKINYLENANQADSFTVSVVMPDQFVNGQFTEKTVIHTIDNTSKMYNTLILFRKLIAFAVVAYFAIRIRFELPHLIRGE